MYSQFFGLHHEPFSIAPDPRYLFMSERHREALAHLLYGVRGGGGFVLLTGEVGAGKTTVCRCFLEQIPRRCNVAYIFNPKLTVPELLKTVCDEFHIPVEPRGPGAATVKDYIDPLNDFLLKTHAVGQNNVLIIDEAQSLSADVLEQLRLLTNLETSERKLLQIILIGQPELRTMLARPELEQLAQRVVARFHLDALTETETAQYIRHRLVVAGLTKGLPFDREALQRIHALSRGVPRRINLLCDRALLGAYAGGSSKVRREIVDQAAGEVFEPASLRLRADGRWLGIGLGALAGAALLGVGLWALDRGAGSTTAVAALPSAASAASGAASVPAGGASAVALAAASAVAPSASAASAPPDRLTALTREPEEAWRELAALWQIDVGDGADPCATAPDRPFQCHRSSGGNLALLRQLARPGILTLYDGSDRPVYTVLTALGSQHATLRLGDVTQTLPLGYLARLWRGEFATFWRTPPGYAGAPIGRDDGAATRWLAVQLASALGDPPPAAGRAPAEPLLKARVQAFQAAQGLAPDGLAGPVTLMHLNRATGVPEPRLQLGP